MMDVPRSQDFSTHSMLHIDAANLLHRVFITPGKQIQLDRIELSITVLFHLPRSILNHKYPSRMTSANLVVFFTNARMLLFSEIPRP